MLIGCLQNERFTSSLVLFQPHVLFPLYPSIPLNLPFNYPSFITSLKCPSLPHFSTVAKYQGLKIKIPCCVSRFRSIFAPKNSTKTLK